MTKSIPRTFAVFAAASFLTACATPAPDAAADTGTGPRFVLTLEPGDFYKTTTKWFIFDFPVYPQVAAWVESTDGTYLGTIFVTAKGESGGWIDAPKEGRPEALPVWSHLRQEEMDAVAAATSPGRTLRGSALAASLAPGRYVVKLETNRSYDFNAAYPFEKVGVVGQPSLVYTAAIEVGAGPAEASFTPVGTGAADGKDGAVRPGLEGIDTALKLFSSITVNYRE